MSGTNQTMNKGDFDMITADKKYIDQKAIMIPSPENFRATVNDSLNFVCMAYASWANWGALLEECSDFDDAMLAALAIKFNGMRSCLKDDRIYFAREVLGAKG